MTAQGGHQPGAGPSVEAEADGAVRGGRRRSAKGPVVVVGLATAVVMALAAAVATGPEGLTGGTASAAVVARSLPGAQGSAELRRSATRVAALPNDVGSGRYAMIETETWASREPPSEKDGEVPADVVVPYHESRTEWFADDHSGRWVVDTTPRGGAPEHDEAVEPPSEAAAGWDPRFRRLPTEDAAYAAFVKEELDGVLPWFVAGDSGDERDVARYLAEYGDPSPFLGLVIVARQFADSDGGHQPRSPEERAAVLRYLATVPGTVVTDGVKDPAGRAGIAVSANAPADFRFDQEGRQSVTLLFDRTSGNLLASRSSFHAVEAPVTDVRYRYPDDRVVLVRTARFTDRLG